MTTPPDPSPHPSGQLPDGESLYRAVLQVFIGLLLTRGSANWTLIRRHLRIEPVVRRVRDDLVSAGILHPQFDGSGWSTDPYRNRDTVGTDDLLLAWHTLDLAAVNRQGKK